MVGRQSMYRFGWSPDHPHAGRKAVSDPGGGVDDQVRNSRHILAWLYPSSNEISSQKWTYVTDCNECDWVRYGRYDQMLPLPREHGLQHDPEPRGIGWSQVSSTAQSSHEQVLIRYAGARYRCDLFAETEAKCPGCRGRLRAAEVAVDASKSAQPGVTLIGGFCRDCYDFWPYEEFEFGAKRALRRGAHRSGHLWPSSV